MPIRFVKLLSRIFLLQVGSPFKLSILPRLRNQLPIYAPPLPHLYQTQSRFEDLFRMNLSFQAQLSSQNERASLATEMLPELNQKLSLKFNISYHQKHYHCLK